MATNLDAIWAIAPKSMPIQVYEIIRPHENAIESKKPRFFDWVVEETRPSNIGRRAIVHELNEAAAPAKATAIRTSNKEPLKRIFWM